jgi:CHAT domain-containing protein
VDQARAQTDLDEAQVSLAAGRLDEAGTRLWALLPLRDDLPAELACRLWLMFAELHARLDRAALARGYVIQAQALPEALGANPLLKLHELRIRLWLGQAESMTEELSVCDRALEQRGELANRTLLLCEEARAWDRMGRLDRAEACWVRAEEHSRPLEGDSARADVLLQLGRLDHLCGQLQAALNRYDAARACAVSGPRWQEAQLRRMLVLLELGQREQALPATGIEQLAEAVRPIARMVQILLAEVRQDAVGDEAERACALYRQALEETSGPARQARLRLALGMLARAVGDVGEARRWLDRADHLAEKENLPEVRCRTLQARGELLAERGEDQQARELFEQAVLLSESQANTISGGLRRNEVLPLLLRAACRRGDPAAVFDYQERERGWRLSRAVDMAELEKALRPGTVYLSPSIFDDEFYLLVVRAGRPVQVVRGHGSALQLAERVERFRGCLDEQADRATLDACLEELADTCLGNTLEQVLAAGERILWVPEDVLHGVPLHALRRDGRYLIETHEIVYSPGGSLLVHHARTPARQRMVPRALVLCESPAGTQEGEGVVGSFWRGAVLHGEQASRSRLHRHLAGVSVLHLACPAYDDARQPLSAFIRLPSGETWRAPEWAEEPLDGLPLVTLCACGSAEPAALSGREAVSLVTGFLACGVRCVLAGLWPTIGQETRSLMWRFYRARMTASLPAALAQAQRETLRQPDSSPLFWAAFALFGDPEALPGPGPWFRWLARWRQARHARRFP